MEANRSAPMRPRTGEVLALTALVFLLRAAFAMAVIPPWQHPDEVQHFAAVRAIAQAPRLGIRLRTDPAVEQEISVSMADFGWWGHVGQADPVDANRVFWDDPYLAKAGVLGVLYAPPVYYAVAGGSLHVVGLTDLLLQLRAARAFSVVIGLLTLWAVWAGTWQLFGSAETAAGASGLLALHPQFVLASTAANPDSLVNLLAAVIYWQFASIVTGHRANLSFGVLTVAALVAVFTKRLGAPLLVVAGIAAIWLLVVTMRRSRYRLIISTSLVALTVVAGLALLWFGGPEVARIANDWSRATNAPLEADPLSWSFLQTFIVTLVRSSWLWFGWMAYPAPNAWMIVPWIVTVAAIGGAVLALVRTRDGAVRRGLIVGGLFVVIQLAVVLVTFYARGRLAQGRYLFPAIGPWLALVWVGVLAWWPAKFQKAVGALLIAAFCVLDFTGWWLYIVPTYAR